jgi:hypothetical protein
VGPQGPKGATGSRGANGTDGTNGTNGTDGTNGSSVLTGSGVPSGSCTSGDSDVDTTANGGNPAGEVYNCVSAAWVDSGNSIRGPQGPAGLSTGVSAGNQTHVLVDGGATDPITVMTGPPVTTSGVYYLTASLTIEIAQGDFVGCSLAPASSESSAEEIGPATATGFQSMSLNGEVSLTVGQSPSINCIDANSNTTTQTGEGDLNAVLINSSTVGSGGSGATPQGQTNLHHQFSGPLGLATP